MRPFTTDQLCRLARAYCDGAGISTGALSARVFTDKNHKLFQRLIDGFDCTASNAERASRWFAENWPADVPWPSDVPAPKADAA